MPTLYREPDNDPDESVHWLLIAFIVFLAIVGPCMFLMRLRR